MSSPDTLSNKTTNPYVGSELIEQQSTDHTFVNKNIRGLLVTSTGNVKIRLKYDTHDITIPVYVPSGGSAELRGYMIKILRSTGNGTTATVLAGLI